ncbi:hypothetical protein E2C01_020001 [Portunus trituberculatus]|uniref:Uncharacterized protein n=1 Tax=Portunus trituberculatus TaxID=210409 RepID=A0A5B7DZ24_PORTR|nr:hypothetical protein [Portunus trituberculatus]
MDVAVVMGGDRIVVVVVVVVESEERREQTRNIKKQSNILKQHSPNMQDQGHPLWQHYTPTSSLV